MLYTFSKSHYDYDELTSLLQHLSEDDILLFWLDGVLLPLKYPKLFKQLNHLQLALNLDVQARNLSKLLQQKTPQIEQISIEKCVDISAQYFPQVAY